MVYINRKEHFNAAHRLYKDDWSREKNREIYGVCANDFGHGHDFELIVTVKGHPDPESGFVMDMKKLGDLIKEEIITRVHQRDLNTEVDFLKGKQPTCEVLVMEFWKILAPKIAAISQARLHAVKLYETQKNFVEYFGEE
ncbi:MAG: 6-carboxytetrahydropterin synthase [Microscillaceae bacterium]|nr:6-carboxytetrahydropterin synthase [Microscillaceae bacterium]